MHTHPHGIHTHHCRLRAYRVYCGCGFAFGEQLQCAVAPDAPPQSRRFSVLSRSDFETLFNTNREQLNAEYARATAEEQTQMRAWLDEISPPPELLDGIPSLERIL